MCLLLGSFVHPLLFLCVFVEVCNKGMIGFSQLWESEPERPVFIVAAVGVVIFGGRRRRKQCSDAPCIDPLHNGVPKSHIVEGLQNMAVCILVCKR